MFFNITGKGDMVLAGANSSVTTQDAVKPLILSNGLKISTRNCETPAKVTLQEKASKLNRGRWAHHATRIIVPSNVSRE